MIFLPVPLGTSPGGFVYFPVWVAWFEQSRFSLSSRLFSA